MVYKKLVTLSSLVLVLAVIAINAGGSKGGQNGGTDGGPDGGRSGGPKGPPPKEMMCVMAYCLDCPNIKDVMTANRACVKAAIPDIVSAAGDTTGESCFQSMRPKKGAGPPSQDSDTKDKLTKCSDSLITNGGAELKACGDAARAAWKAKRNAKQ